MRRSGLNNRFKRERFWDNFPVEQCVLDSYVSASYGDRRKRTGARRPRRPPVVKKAKNADAPVRRRRPSGKPPFETL
ncbi:hypothetical protein EVAR_67524_1 [Eumeta japonica]|uniref:Uncharacterized protein n=1 Tax=Eumeta variegata TaxID=151549 RepID=A0A4C1YYS8_EUMVA|nr:hypothetical protein EVAR_67524_1 [Eumeta japonica]